MYSMDNLLTLISTEHARELRFCAGTPPVVVLGEEPHAMEGPPLTTECAEQLLRSIANTRQMRELWEQGTVTFIYTLPGASPFLVRAALEGENVTFKVE
jgi:Tfp pilus assembly pilus retraction ATPase PilT